MNEKMNTNRSVTFRRSTVITEFPFHAVVDAAGIVVAAGPSLQKIAPPIIGSHFKEYLKLEYPNIAVGGKLCFEYLYADTAGGKLCTTIALF
jgi:hypothetical protein